MCSVRELSRSIVHRIIMVSLVLYDEDVNGVQVFIDQISTTVRSLNIFGLKIFIETFNLAVRSSMIFQRLVSREFLATFFIEVVCKLLSVGLAWWRLPSVAGVAPA